MASRKNHPSKEEVDDTSEHAASEEEGDPGVPLMEYFQKGKRAEKYETFNEDKEVERA